ncbi:hypothetical protein ACFPMF_22970 [Larkinella bovis]|uniref:HEAT repeat domain-containing protein n=1 Tax=Larkinella bovis TaxID=683041 RepID=A0ABW0IG28_9BACT
MEDKLEYARRLRSELQSAEEKQASLLDQFRQATRVGDFQKILKDIPFIKEPDAVEKAKALFLDKQRNATVRSLALQKITTAILGDGAFISQCLAVLADPVEPVLLRKNVLNVLGALSFASPVFRAMRSDYLAVLRGLLDDPDPGLREEAAGMLANEQDEFVQNRLLNGLKGDEKPIVSTAKAIQLLSRDAHANYYPVVREILQNPETDKTARVEAIHALAFDQESKPLLARLFSDKRQSKEVRMSSATAFQAAHPDDFIELAKPVILDEKEKKDIRAVSLNALMHHRDADAIYADEQFRTKVSRLKAPKSAPELKKLSKQYLEKANRFRKTDQ